VKNQHYVWRFYLAAWEVRGTFWCYRYKAKKLFETQCKAIASETYFYRTHQLTTEDRDFLEAVIVRASDEKLRQLNREAVELFQKSFELRAYLKATKLNDQAKNDVKRDLELIEKNLGERYHTGIENKSRSILESLRREDRDFYRDVRLCGDFLYFLSHQYFRTAKMRHAVSGVARPVSGHDARRTAGIECHIYATNVSVGLFRERAAYRIVFLKNDTRIPFVVGDQPVVNMLDPATTDDLELYYPLSPKLALVLTRDDQKFPHQKRNITTFEVEHYNYTMFRLADDQVYSSDESYLRSLISMGKNVLSQ
jgi:hypothetical protein